MLWRGQTASPVTGGMRSGSIPLDVPIRGLLDASRSRYIRTNYGTMDMEGAERRAGVINPRGQFGLRWLECAYRWTGTNCRAAALDRDRSRWSWESDAGAAELDGGRRRAADQAELGRD